MLPAMNMLYRCNRTGTAVFVTTYTSSACFLKTNRNPQLKAVFPLVAIKLLHSEQLTARTHLSSPDTGNLAINQVRSNLEMFKCGTYIFHSPVWQFLR